MTDELQHDRLHPDGQQPFTGFRFAPPVFTDSPATLDSSPRPLPTEPLVEPEVHELESDFVARPLAATLALDRRPRQKQRSTGMLDWVAFVLAFLAPPVGFLTGIAAVVVGERDRGWSTGIAKAAIGVGLALSLVLAGGGLVLSRNAGDAAAHQAIVAESAKWCSAIEKDPAMLRSDTFDWPAISGSIASSLPAMQAYTEFWSNLVKIAPAGIRADTQRVASAASRITVGVTTSRVLDDASNVAQMQQVVGSSSIVNWASEYCN